MKNTKLPYAKRRVLFSNTCQEGHKHLRVELNSYTQNKFWVNFIYEM